MEDSNNNQPQQAVPALAITNRKNCTSNCWLAHGQDCHCSCQGNNHGALIGNPGAQQPDGPGDSYQTAILIPGRDQSENPKTHPRPAPTHHHPRFAFQFRIWFRVRKNTQETPQGERGHARSPNTSGAGKQTLDRQRPPQPQLQLPEPSLHNPRSPHEPERYPLVARRPQYHDPRLVLPALRQPSPGKYARTNPQGRAQAPGLASPG